LALYYGPLVQLWVTATILSALFTLLGDVDALARIQTRAPTWVRRPKTESEMVRQELENILPRGGGQAMVEVISEGIFSSDGKVRRDTVRELFQELRSSGQSPARRFLYSMLIMIAVTAILLGGLAIAGVSITDSNCWIIALPFILQIVIPYLVDYTLARSKNQG
jgi:hypothetical protein